MRKVSHKEKPVNQHYRFSLSDRDLISFLEAKSLKHNIAVSTIASKLLKLVTANHSHEVEKYLQSLAKSMRPEDIRPFLFEDYAFSYTEVFLLARLMKVMKLDSIPARYNSIASLFPDLSYKQVRAALITFEARDLLLYNTYPADSVVTKQESVWTLAPKSFILVNRAIDGGYLT